MRINILIVMIGLLLSVPDARSTGTRTWLKKGASLSLASREEAKLKTGTDFNVVVGDITKQDGFAIVNAANPEVTLSPRMAGVTKAIADAAGSDLAKLEEVVAEAKKDPAQRAVGPVAKLRYDDSGNALPLELQNQPVTFNSDVLAPGSVLITKGDFGELGKRDIHVILHAVAPFRGESGLAERWRKNALQEAYMNALSVVSKEETGKRKVAFPLLGAGVYGWPKEEAINAAIEAIKAFATLKNLDEIRIVVLSEDDKKAVEKAFKNKKLNAYAVLRAEDIIGQ
jgi:O-acetyl-ADP-ribose deacetylase (regulator of RNase III)